MATIITRDGARGRTYQVKWRDDHGQQRSKTFKRKSDAQNFEAKVKLGVHEEAPEEKPAAPTTLGDVHARYVANRRASRSTLAKERSLSKRLGPIADRPVATLRVSDVRAWVADLVDEGLAPETVAACLRLLRSVLDAAVEDELAAANVAARVKPPRIVKPPLDAEDVLTRDEFEAVLLHIPDRWRALFALRAYCGPRLSEALAMKHGDVDLLRRRVHVGHRVLEDVDGVAELREGGKTGRGSDRWVPVPDRVVTLLEHHLATYPPGRDGLLFSSDSGGYVSRDNLRRRVWEPANRAAKVDGKPVTRVTMKNLRHTAASWMFAAGLDPLEVSFRMGHSKPSTTLDVYARFRPRSHDQVDPYNVALGKVAR